MLCIDKALVNASLNQRRFTRAFEYGKPLPLSNWEWLGTLH